LFFLLSFFSCLVCLVTKFLPCTDPACAKSLLELVVLDSVAPSFLFSARNSQRCMFLQELSTLGEHRYNALKSRAYHPTQHLRARGCIAIAATGVKVQVLYQVIEPLDSSLPGRLLAAGRRPQRLLRLQVLSALENSSPFPRRNNPTDQLIGYSRSCCSLEQRFLFLTRRRTSVSTPLLPSIVAFASQVQASPHHAERRHKHLLCQDLD